MPLKYIRNDIARMNTQAVVLPANEYLLKGPGASTALFEAAGERELEHACKLIGYVPMGEAAVTEGFGLKAEYIVHAVVPLWQGGNCGEEGFLRKAYRSSLQKAMDLGVGSISFPLLSSGNFGYPKDEALEVAVEEISKFLDENEYEPDVYIVLYGSQDVKAARSAAPDIVEYIDNHYVEEQMKVSYRERRSTTYLPGLRRQDKSIMASYDIVDECEICECSIEEAIDEEEKSFSQTLLDLIDSRGMSDPEAYRASNIDRKLFNKIKNSRGYTPKKNTVLAFCIGLKLTLEEAEDLLGRAGYALSPCIRFDLAVKYFLETGKYGSIHDVNIALFEMFEMSL